MTSRVHLRPTAGATVPVSRALIRTTEQLSGREHYKNRVLRYDDDGPFDQDLQTELDVAKTQIQELQSEIKFKEKQMEYFIKEYTEKLELDIGGGKTIQVQVTISPRKDPRVNLLKVPKEQSKQHQFCNDSSSHKSPEPQSHLYWAKKELENPLKKKRSIIKALAAKLEAEGIEPASICSTIVAAKLPRIRINYPRKVLDAKYKRQQSAILYPN